MSDDFEYPTSWIILGYIVACFNFAAFVCCSFVFQALLRNSSIRKNSYNIYVIFLIFPDALQNLFAIARNICWQGFPQGLYEVSVFVWFFYFTTNFYLNLVVSYEINSLVSASYYRQKTAPPKVERAWKQVVMVYLFAVIASTWVILPYKWSLMDINDGVSGSIAFGSPNGGVFSSKLATMVCFAVIGVPTVYVMYIRIRIACLKLLPKRGRTRVLSLFFLRIIIVFLCLYLPNTLLNAALPRFGDNPVPMFWIKHFAGPLLNAIQACVTLYMVLLKNDIRTAIANDWNGSFGKCCCHMAETVPGNRPDMQSVSITPSSLRIDSNTVNRNSSSISASFRTEETLPKKSEWDEEDVYVDKETLDLGIPTGNPESGCTEVIEEESPSSSQDDEEAPANCRDCTNDWVERRASGGSSSSCRS